MHEAALALELLRTIEQVARANGALRVASARLEVGALTAVEPDALAFAFEVCARGTLAEGCALAVERVRIAISCPACGYAGPAEGLGCPTCGAPSVHVTAGREFRLVAIDVHDPPEEATCT